MYLKLKDDNTGVTQPDNSALYYVVDSSWVTSWKAFIKDKAMVPFEMDNSNLRNFILSWRQ
jgi:hypothetical protein